MNEQIRELWHKAAIDTHQNESTSWENEVKFIEKFAELIVQECAKAADKGLAEVTMKGPEWPSYYIKKHFGVEQ